MSGHVTPTHQQRNGDHARYVPPATEVTPDGRCGHNLRMMRKAMERMEVDMAPMIGLAMVGLLLLAVFS